MRLLYHALMTITVIAGGVILYLTHGAPEEHTVKWIDASPVLASDGEGDIFDKPISYLVDHQLGIRDDGVVLIRLREDRE